jgi:small-conductance mechanosensitive channel
MNMKPTNTLSERERRILRDLERDLASRHIDPVKRLVLAAVLVAVGALVALVTFPVSVVAATAGLATMGAGIGFGLSPAQPLLRRQLARFTKGGKAEDPS